jgi:hypothetical protein
MTAEQAKMQATMCRFPADDVVETSTTVGGFSTVQHSKDGVCEMYDCAHFSKKDCENLEPMLAFLDPGATAKDHFDCDTLMCASCPFESCSTHGPSGCMYDASLTDAQLEAKFAGWRYSPPSLAGPVEGEGDICGHTIPNTIAGSTNEYTERRGSYNTEYTPAGFTPIEKCLCEECWMTVNDHSNRMTQGGGYIAYCNLNICDDTGKKWATSSGGFAVTDAKASQSTAPAHFQTFAAIADTLGLSPEVAYLDKLALA